MHDIHIGEAVVFRYKNDRDSTAAYEFIGVLKSRRGEKVVLSNVKYDNGHQAVPEADLQLDLDNIGYV